MPVLNELLIYIKTKYRYQLAKYRAFEFKKSNKRFI